MSDVYNQPIAIPAFIQYLKRWLQQAASLSKSHPEFSEGSTPLSDVVFQHSPTRILIVLAWFLLTLASAQVCAVPGRVDPTTISGSNVVVNTYYPGTAFVSSTQLTLGTARGDTGNTITAGDLLLVIQMQDAQINTNNDERYGDGSGSSGNTSGNGSGASNWNNAGRYEYAVASNSVAAAGGTLTLRSALQFTYANADAVTSGGSQRGQRRFQVVRVPQYSSLTLTGSISAAPWDGSSGGMVVLEVAGAFSLSGSINADGVGFRGGGARNVFGDNNVNNLDYASTNGARGGTKAEGVAGTPEFVRNNGTVSGGMTTTDVGPQGYPAGDFARGAPGNAGGGGTSHNAGGGGGGNGGTGGKGGRSFNGDSSRDVGGWGGAVFPYTAYTAGTRLALGGGGGAGDINNADDNNSLAQAGGGAGGGIVLVRAGSIGGSGTINARGQDGQLSGRDGAGGGGAGGTVMVQAPTGSLSSITINATGGAGGNSNTYSMYEGEGPGGGGGGGVVVSNLTLGSFSVAGGANGTSQNGWPTANGFTAQYGASSGGGTTLSTSLSSAQPDCSPQLSLSKTVNNASPTAGDTVQYTITLSNAANRGTATNISISDVLPGAPSAFSLSGTPTITLGGSAPNTATRPSTSNPSTGSTSPAWSTFEIPGGGSVTIQFNAQIASSTLAGIYPNSVVANYRDPSRTSSAGQASSNFSGAAVDVGVPVSGWVYNDSQPNFSLETTEVGTGQTVFVKLVSRSGSTCGSTVLQTATVNTATTVGGGSFSFSRVGAGDFCLLLDTLNDSTNNTRVPTGWLRTEVPSGQRSLTVSAAQNAQNFGLFFGYRLTGTIFRDDGRSSGTANNALQDGGEPGVASVAISATAGSNTRSSQTAANGSYELYIPNGFGAATLEHSQNPATGSNNAGSSVQLTTAFNVASARQRSLGTLANGQSYTYNFGVVFASQFTPDQSGQTSSPGLITYQHQYRPGTMGTVNLSVSGGLTYQVRRAASCGSLAATDGLQAVPLSFVVNSSWPRDPDGRFSRCLIEVAVIVPAARPGGSVDIAQVRNSLTWLNNTAVNDVEGVIDNTTVLSSGGLRLDKAVRNVTQNNPAGATNYATSIGGRPGDTLEYCIAFRNLGTGNLTNPVMTDPVPFFTNFTASSLTLNGGSLTDSSDSDVGEYLSGSNQIRVRLGSFSGSTFTLAPGSNGTVCYRVTIR